MSETTVSAPTALYAYGVVPSGTHLALPGAGVGDTDVDVVEAGGVAAIAGVVPLSEFGEEPLRANLNDREWLERTARAHEAVLERALGTTTVIPFRIATLYASEEGLREFLEERAKALCGLLAYLEGKVELGVKAYFDRSGATSADEADTGRAYLLQRQAEEKATRDADAFAIACARESHERLARAAVEARVNRAQPSELSGRSEQMLLNAAYLVPRGDAALDEAVQELERQYAERGVTYELTGPWPPYNFVPRDLTP